MSYIPPYEVLKQKIRVLWAATLGARAGST